MEEPDIFDLVTRLQQLEQESDLLASQQQELQRQLQAAETARDRRRKGPEEPISMRSRKWFLKQAPDRVDEQDNGWPLCLHEAAPAGPVQIGNCGGEIRRIQVDFRK
jgi:hypothetical protein